MHPSPVLLREGRPGLQDHLIASGGSAGLDDLGFNPLGQHHPFAPHRLAGCGPEGLGLPIKKRSRLAAAMGGGGGSLGGAPDLQLQQQQRAGSRGGAAAAAGGGGAAAAAAAGSNLDSLLQAVEAVEADSSEDADYESGPSHRHLHHHLGNGGPAAGGGRGARGAALRGGDGHATDDSAGLGPPAGHHRIPAQQQQPRIEDILGIRLAPCSVPLFQPGARPLPNGHSTHHHGPRTLPVNRAPGSGGGGGPSGLPLSLPGGPAAPKPSSNGNGAYGGDLALPHVQQMMARSMGAGLATMNGLMLGGHPLAGIYHGTMGVVLSSPVLASMPAAQMSTVSLFKAVKYG